MVRFTNGALDHAFAFFSTISAPFGLKIRAFALRVYGIGQGKQRTASGSRMGTSGGQLQSNGQAATRQLHEQQHVKNQYFASRVKAFGCLPQSPLRWEAIGVASERQWSMRTLKSSRFHNDWTQRPNTEKSQKRKKINFQGFILHLFPHF